METSGKVIQVLPIQEGVSQQGKAWSSQGFVIETHDQYPRKQYIEIFGKERIEKNLPKVDDDVTASIDIESREFNGRWYTSVRAWKVEKTTAAATAQQAAAQPMPPASPAAPTIPPMPQAPQPSVSMEESTEQPF